MFSVFRYGKIELINEKYFVEIDNNLTKLCDYCLFTVDYLKHVMLSLEKHSIELL